MRPTCNNGYKYLQAEVGTEIFFANNRDLPEFTKSFFVEADGVTEAHVDAEVSLLEYSVDSTTKANNTTDALQAADDVKRPSGTWKGADVYGFSFSDATQQWETRSLSDDCPYAGWSKTTNKLSPAEAATAMKAVGANVCMDQGYFSDVSSSSLRTAIRSRLSRTVPTLTIGATAGVWTGQSQTGGLGTGLEVPLDQKYLICDPTKNQIVPLSVSYTPDLLAPTQKANITNLKAMYCPVQ